MRPLTASPSSNSSNSAPEEFPVEPENVKGNEPSSSAPISLEPVSAEKDVPASHEEPSIEPSEDSVPELSTKPLPRVNAVAQEVRVRATGTRPGIVRIERELFTESTTTVLVFEKGAVIRLAAAVTPGQLLFLTNEESKREIVAQVMRKRTFRPTECYVELEFSEYAQGFWGKGFSAATALLPKDAAQLAAAEMVASSETTADEPGEPAPPPSSDEILALKKEVEALRSQLRLLQPEEASQQTASSAAIPHSLTSAPPAEAARAVDEQAPSLAMAAKSLPIGKRAQPGPVTAADRQYLPQQPFDYGMALPKRKRLFRARGNLTPGFRTGALRLAVLVVALLVTMTGAAWYKHWIPNWIPSMRQPKKLTVASVATLVTTTGTVPEAKAAVPEIAKTQTGNTDLGKETPASLAAASKSPALPTEPEEQPTTASEHSEHSSLPREPRSEPAVRGKATPRALTRTSAHAPAVAPADSVPVSTTDSPVLAPKLIRSVRAVASLDDLRDFETGSIIIDAIIDTAGEVKSMSVLSGPPSLRRPALEALKNYKYEPATQNGKPVPAHVKVKIQFHFE
jgi:hypothetical protein